MIMRKQGLTSSATFVASILTAGALSLAATPAAAKEKAQVEQAAAAKQGSGLATDAKADEKICRNLTVTGSRMSKNRVCLTREDWKKVEEER
jgi:hypothetical protein